jgi:hypothetical protein
MPAAIFSIAAAVAGAAASAAVKGGILGAIVGAVVTAGLNILGAVIFPAPKPKTPNNRVCPHCVGYGVSDSSSVGGLGSWANDFG